MQFYYNSGRVISMRIWTTPTVTNKKNCILFVIVGDLELVNMMFVVLLLSVHPQSLKSLPDYGGFDSHRGQANFSACPVWMHTRSNATNKYIVSFLPDWKLAPIPGHKDLGFWWPGRRLHPREGHPLSRQPEESRTSSSLGSHQDNICQSKAECCMPIHIHLHSLLTLLDRGWVRRDWGIFWQCKICHLVLTISEREVNALRQRICARCDTVQHQTKVFCFVALKFTR